MSLALLCELARALAALPRLALRLRSLWHRLRGRKDLVPPRLVAAGYLQLHAHVRLPRGLAWGSDSDVGLEPPLITA